VKSRGLLRVIGLLGLGLFTFLSVSSASALDTPVLSWERGRVQTVTLGGNTSNELWKIELVGNGENLAFERSKIDSKGFLVYSVMIPADFKVGDYSVQVIGTNNKPAIVSYVRIISVVAYSPLADPKGVGTLSVIAFTLLSLLSLNRLAPSAVSDSDPTQLSGVDGKYQNIRYTRQGKFDVLNIGRFPINYKTDVWKHLTVFRLSSRSPMLMRVLSDSAYAQALTGAFSFLLPLSGVVLGLVLGLTSKLNETVIPANFTLVAVLLVIGIFDSAAGLIGYFGYLIPILVTGHVHSLYDIRGLLGLALVFFTPSLIAGSTRPLRRDEDSWQAWERLGDFVISCVLSGWAVKGLVGALDGFTHTHTPLATYAGELGILAGAVVLLRYFAEELASRLVPIRIAFLNPQKIHQQTRRSFVLSVWIRIFLFLFFMYGFLGFTWQIFAATLMLSIPLIAGRFKNSLPNSTTLFQIIPSGMPGTILMAFVGFVFANWVESWPLIVEDRTKTIFILCGIPSFVLSLLKLFGRTPKQGDVIWYKRENFSVMYYLLSPLAVGALFLITFGVIP